MREDLNELRLQNEDPEVQAVGNMIADAQQCLEDGQITGDEFKEILEDIQRTKLIRDKSNQTIWTNRALLVVSTLISLY